MYTQAVRVFSRIDLRLVVIVLLLQLCGLLTIAAYSQDLLLEPSSFSFFHSNVKSQLQWMVFSWGCFFVAVRFNYAKLREWAWFLYFFSIIALIGLFFTDPIVRVQRWYRIPLIGISVQPSEVAKVAVVVALSWFLERRALIAERLSTLLGALAIVGLPFLLILKQPDLGTATVLYPMTLVILYFGGVSLRSLKILCLPGLFVVVLVFLTFSGIVPHDQMRPYMTRFLKEYQCERLNPDTHHQRASQTAIAIGGTKGAGWRQGEYWRGGSLPAPYTDSIFAAFGEEFGLIGVLFLLILYYFLISCCFQTVAMAKDSFGRLIASGIAVYITVHVVINVGMMCGCLPVTGVPLLLMSYGGSSLAMTMKALGITQSVYSRRFMF